MARHKIPKHLIVVNQDDESNFNIYQLDKEYKLTYLTTSSYSVWNIEIIYDQIRSDIFVSPNEKVQMIMQIDDNTFQYRSCNNVGQVYTINVNANEIECDCTYSSMFVKTGNRSKLCHHVIEVSHFIKERGGYIIL